MSKQRFLSNKDSVIREAALTASATATASGTARPIPLDRVGSGVVQLTGAYSGSATAQFDIKISDGSLGATPQASAPILAGPGNGEMADLSVDAGTDPQDFVVTLRELAKPAVTAEANADGLRVLAKADGAAAGNGTFLHVDRSTLTDAETGLLVPSAAVAGSIETSGPAWDFGALPLFADGTINPATARIRFGDDPQVYRQYSIQRNGFTVFRFMPALVRPIAAGIKVWSVSGGRTVTITRGQPTNRFAVVTPPALTGNLRCVACNGSLKFVGATDDGELVFSLDGGLTWALAATNPFSASINALAYDAAAARFIAAGNGGAIAYSADGGNHWTASGASGFGADHIYSLAVGAGLLMAAGASGKVATSSDSASTWTLQTSSAMSDADILDLVFVLDRFIGAGTDGALAQTLDGATWEDLDSPISAGTDITALAFEPRARRLALGTDGGEIHYSKDLGATWTEATTPHLGDAIKDLTSAVGLIAAIDVTGRISTSRDLLTWTAITNAPLDEGTAIAASGNGTFIAADNDEFARALLAEVLTSSIVARYQFLYRIYGGTLLSSPTPLVFDERPGGVGYLEFQPATGAIAPTIARGSSSMQLLAGLAIGEAAPTQTVTIVCTDDGTPGSEAWEVTTLDGVSTATTDQPYNDATLSFEIAPKATGGYAVGEAYEIQILAASPVVLGGGTDAIADSTWSVEGSVDGVLDDYAQAPTPADYTAGLIVFKIVNGTVPFGIGSRFTFSVEGGKFQWQKDGGGYSADIDVVDGPVALSDGMSAVFTRGITPSFVEDDVYSFLVRQSYGVDNLRRPSPEQFRWSSGPCAVIADLGAALDIDTLVIARHSIPDNATITVEGSSDNFATVDWTETLTWRRGVIVHILDQVTTQTHLRLTVDQPSAIGWWGAMEASSVTPDADRITIRRAYSMRKGSKTSGFVGRGHAGEIAYDGFLSVADVDELEAIVDWSREYGDEPLVLVPNVDQPEDSALLVPDSDFAPEDIYQLQSESRTQRNYSAPPLQFAAVIE